MAHLAGGVSGLTQHNCATIVLYCLLLDGGGVTGLQETWPQSESQEFSAISFQKANKISKHYDQEMYSLNVPNIMTTTQS